MLTWTFLCSLVINTIALLFTASNCYKTQDHKKAAKNKNDERKAFRAAVEKGEAGVPAPTDSVPQIGKVVKQRLDLTKAKKFLPPHTSIYHYAPTNRIRGFIGNERVGRGCDLSKGQDVACRVVLTKLWELHHQRNPRSIIAWEFPLDLEALQ